MKAATDSALLESEAEVCRQEEAIKEARFVNEDLLAQRRALFDDLFDREEEDVRLLTTSVLSLQASLMEGSL